METRVPVEGRIARRRYKDSVGSIGLVCEGRFGRRAVGFRGWGGVVFEPFVCPGGDGVHDAIEGEAFLGEVVFDADGGIGNDGALDDSFGFEFLEPFGEEAVVQAGDGLGDIGETIATAAHGSEDGPVPALANEFDRPMEGRTEGGWDWLVVHNVDSNQW